MWPLCFKKKNAHHRNKYLLSIYNENSVLVTDFSATALDQTPVSSLDHGSVAMSSEGMMQIIPPLCRLPCLSACCMTAQAFHPEALYKDRSCLTHSLSSPKSNCACGKSLKGPYPGLPSRLLTFHLILF